MSLPRLFGFFAVVLFGGIMVAFFLKKRTNVAAPSTINFVNEQVEIEINPKSLGDDEEFVEEIFNIEPLSNLPKNDEKQIPPEALPDANRIQQLFNIGEPKLPIVETITYKSNVHWLHGRPAWIADYSSHYKTSRHFIARSLNGCPNYEKQDVKNGDKFNVLNSKIDLEFYLVIDLLASRLWLYYVDKDADERVLLKSYPVGIGRPDPMRASGYLTPTGIYSLGEKIAVYRPKAKGFYQGEKIEMVQVFGSRWIPFGTEIAHCTEPAKGYGIHGLPLKSNDSGKYEEDLASLGNYESDGCVRMATKDVEELFAIIITRPTTVELVKGFHNAHLPGKEKLEVESLSLSSSYP